MIYYQKNNDFPHHFKQRIIRYEKIVSSIDVFRQTICLVVNAIKVNSFAFLLNSTTLDPVSDSTKAPTKKKHRITQSWVGTTVVKLVGLFSSGIPVLLYLCPLCFGLVLILMFLGYCAYEPGIFHADRETKYLTNQNRTESEAWATKNRLSPSPNSPSPVIALVAVLSRYFCFGSSWLLCVLLRYCLCH